MGKMKHKLDKGAYFTHRNKFHQVDLYRVKRRLSYTDGEDKEVLRYEVIDMQENEVFECSATLAESKDCKQITDEEAMQMLLEM